MTETNIRFNTSPFGVDIFVNGYYKTTVHDSSETPTPKNHKYWVAEGVKHLAEHPDLLS